MIAPARVPSRKPRRTVFDARAIAPDVIEDSAAVPASETLSVVRIIRFAPRAI